MCNEDLTNTFEANDGKRKDTFAWVTLVKLCRDQFHPEICWPATSMNTWHWSLKTAVATLQASHLHLLAELQVDFMKTGNLEPAGLINGGSVVHKFAEAMFGIGSNSF